MRIRWRNLELPTKVVADPATRTDTYAKFVAEPFERGFGVTVGNGLRRVLLSSIEGTAVTSVKIQGVKHEFSSLEGVKEDVTDLVLAFKRLRVRFHTDDPKVLTVDKRGPGPVTGADVQCGSDCEVVNKDLVICTLTTDRAFEAEIEVKKGRGYVTQEENAREEHEIGVIPLDAIYSPVQRVRYRTENTRVGKMTNYDRLILELWTDGTVTPEMALVEAGKIYRKHLNPFVHFFDVGRELGTPGAAPTMGEVAPAAAPVAAPVATAAPADLKKKLEMPVSALDLSVRASNALEAEGIQTVGELVRRTEEQLLKLKNFGRTSVKEVEKKLQALELSFGMDVAAATKDS
ncbi:MAG: DNA-directed RNA polymerase subunit alpha [Planctomycetes bacterium]|nr:DNA-directed RNA polymerase subunit alpha [Planctomycetota bacterium]